MPDLERQVVDRDALHRYLWERTNSRARIHIHQTKLAEALNVTRGTMYRVMKEMVDAGRMHKVEALPRNVGVFVIANPDTWTNPKAQPEPQRRLQWG